MIKCWWKKVKIIYFVQNRSPVDARRKLNVDKTFRRWTSSERLMYVQFTSSVYGVRTNMFLVMEIFLLIMQYVYLTACKISVFGVILVRIFPHSDANNSEYGYVLRSTLFFYLFSSYENLKVKIVNPTPWDLNFFCWILSLKIERRDFSLPQLLQMLRL